jgi:uncharacterized protein YndB with AHSA1/START domain
MADSVSVQRTIAAPAERLWDLIADLPGMGRWSPENTGGSWVGGAAGATVGARFRGTNASGSKRWSTTAEIVTATRPSELAWDVTVGPLGVARWHYRFEPSGSGTIVTETWTDHRNPVIAFLVGRATKVTDRAAHNRAGMEETLRRLAEAAEQPGA